jgi:hypothetical protein
MKINDDVKQIAYLIANRIIEKFRNKEFKDTDEELIVIEATMIVVGVEKSASIIEEAISENHNEGIEITEDYVMYMMCVNNHLFSRISASYIANKSYNSVTLEQIIEDWKETQKPQHGVEKYFNTQSDHFNYNAYFWFIEIKDGELFPDIEIPFKILSEYLYFLNHFNTPISSVGKNIYLLYLCVERLKHVI